MSDDESDLPKRLDFRPMQWDNPTHQAQWDRGRAEAGDRLARHGLWIATQLTAARKYVALEARSVRLPPTGWSFVPAVQSLGIDGRVTLSSDDERRDFEVFWLWYLPVENALLELCTLIRFFAPLRPEHAATFDALCTVGHDLAQVYREWQADARIGWLPQRLGWGVYGKRQRLTIVQMLGKHLIEFDNATPPVWTTEAVPPPERAMEMPF